MYYHCSVYFGHKYMGYRNTLYLTAVLIGLFCAGTVAQPRTAREKQNVRTVTIPISIYTTAELRQDQAEEFIQVDRLIVKEDKEEQTILSVRSVMNTPLALAVIIQDNLSQDVNLQLSDLRKFIRGMPRGSRVMVAYIRGGTLRIRQRFTDDLERAAAALQIVGGIQSGTSPFDGVADATNYFESLPSGRRAILLIADGADGSRPDLLDMVSSPELDRAILRAQRRGVAVYSIYSSSALTQNARSRFTAAGQSALNRLADETGGRSFYQGSQTPVSFVPFLKDLGLLLGRQFALTYLSTHMKKGYHRVEVTSTNPSVKIEHPKGYYYR
jgi:VWFA-related protein